MKEKLETIAAQTTEKDKQGRKYNPTTGSTAYEGLKRLGYQTFMGPTSIKYWM